MIKFSLDILGVFSVMYLIPLFPKAKSVLIHWYQKKLETASGSKHGQAHCSEDSFGAQFSLFFPVFIPSEINIIIPQIKGWDRYTHTNVGIKQRIRHNKKLLVSSS